MLDGPGNQLWAYVDKPRAWDAWDLDERYEDRASCSPPRTPSRSSRTARTARRSASSGASTTRPWCRSCACGRARRGSSSAPRSTGTTAAGCSRRASRSPIRSPRATFETAFGVVERATHRNTSWEQARFEVAAHRFVDLSEPGYGAALLNDGRYGHHARDSELGISLLRSPIWPDPLADEGVQEITYALLPHAGTWLEGGVLAEAEDLNRPLLARPVRGEEASLRPLALDGIPVALGALKALEDGGGLALRVWEPQGARGPVALTLPDGWREDGALDVLERPADASGPLRPFEVRTWRLSQRDG